MDHVNAGVLTSQISINAFLNSSSFLEEQLNNLLDPKHYNLNCSHESEKFLSSISAHSNQVDCLVIDVQTDQQALIEQLRIRSVLLPTVLLVNEQTKIPSFCDSDSPLNSCSFYHPAEIKLWLENLDQLPTMVCQAAANFLRLATVARVDNGEAFRTWFFTPSLQEKLLEQQQRLSEKLKERLGYLGIYYKRDSSQFIRNLDEDERKTLLAELREDYRQIALEYFHTDNNVNAQIDEFVTKAFFADISVSWILELHMNLMDSFAKKLKLAGRNEDILLDYRLTLIDTIANLCEMYRRCIPRDS